MTAPQKSVWLERARIFIDPEALARFVDPYRNQPGVRAFALRQLEALILTSRSVVDEELVRRAAALTYYTLLSLVPLLAVGFALFEAFGGLRKMKEPLKAFIVDTLAAGRPDEIGAWLDQFIDNINAGAIAGVGVLVLFYSALGLLTNVEASFNRIWGIERARPLHMRFAIYWCVVTLSPPLLGVSISFSAQLQSSSFATLVLEWLPFGLGGVLVALGAALVVSVAFVLSFVIVPNTKVKLRYALMGGILTSVLWNLSKALYIWFVAGSVKYSAIYGALGALPLLMVWLYLSWIIVLFGVTYTRVCQTFSAERLKNSPELNQQACEHLAAHVLIEIATSFHTGNGGITTEALAKRLHVPATSLFPLLRALTEQRVVLESEAIGEDHAYVPGRDLDSLSLADAVGALRTRGDDMPEVGEGAVHERARGLMAQADRAAHALLADVDLSDLVRTSRRDGDSDADDEGDGDGDDEAGAGADERAGAGAAG